MAGGDVTVVQLNGGFVVEPFDFQQVPLGQHLNLGVSAETQKFHWVLSFDCPHVMEGGGCKTYI